MWKSALTVIGTIAIGVAVRFIYDFWVKPFFSKKNSVKTSLPSKEELKSLKKSAKALKKQKKNTPS
ncbi:MAG: hypothetical protein ACRC9L_09235 [Brevinema sp.]